jgi:uncharacterized protein YdaU (DUF1376 family)
MGKDPAVLLYTSDFLTGTMFMNDEQVGKYIRLLCSQHQHRGIIEKNAFNAVVGDDPVLRSKFIEKADGFYNERLAIEMEKRSKKSEKLAENANKRWNPEIENSKVIQKHNKSNAIAYANGMQIENENENENVVELEKGLQREKPSKTKQFKPPSLDEMKAYFTENGYPTELAERAYNYYSEFDWKDRNGNPVLAWKQKMHGTWFKPENKPSLNGGTSKQISNAEQLAQW